MPDRDARAREVAEAIAKGSWRLLPDDGGRHYIRPERESALADAIVAALVAFAKEERERCAKVAESHTGWGPGSGAEGGSPLDIAAALRSDAPPSYGCVSAKAMGGSHAHDPTGKLEVARPPDWAWSRGPNPEDAPLAGNAPCPDCKRVNCICASAYGWPRSDAP